MINPMDLSGKHVLLTGASQGLGRAIAIHISQLGAKVSLVSRNQDKLNETCLALAGSGHQIFPFDLKRIEEIDGLTSEIVNAGGALSGLIHCAGVADMRPLSMTKYDFLHDMMLINFYPYIELIRCCSKKKNFLPGASFVGISSIAALCGDKSKTAYCSSKAAMDAATRCVAKELGLKKIRVNTVVAGLIKTELYDMIVDNAGEGASLSHILGRQYLGVGEPLDVANAVAYLLSDASKFVTGTGFVVDGGYLS